MSIGSHQQSVGKSQVHLTPRWILDALGSFDLDPCAATVRPWDIASRNIVEAENGLTADWREDEVFLNPPFDRYQVGRWVQKLADHGNGIVLLHARTETDWFAPVQTSKYRATVPMNAQLRTTLEEAKAGALSDYVIEHGLEKIGSVKKGFAAACVRAGLKATPHMLRHSAAVWMAEQAVPMTQIAQFLGHTDSRITERVYARFAPQFLSTAADALEW